jgi:hypothetical protein
MGKRLTKELLLAEIVQQRAALDRTLALVPERMRTKSGVTRGGWSVKDILAHLIEWQQMNLDWYAAGRRGEKPAMPAPDLDRPILDTQGLSEGEHSGPLSLGRHSDSALVETAKQWPIKH